MYIESWLIISHYVCSLTIATATTGLAREAHKVYTWPNASEGDAYTGDDWLKLVEVAEMDTNSDSFTYLIAGGERVPEKMNYAKHMVSIRSRRQLEVFGYNHFCAGVIVTASAVMTSARCIMDKRRVLIRPRTMVLIAGNPERTQRSDTSMSFAINRVIAHPALQHDFSNDLAIVHIKGSFTAANPAILVLPLPIKPPTFGSTCTALGWGRIYNKGPLSDAIMHVDVQLFTPQECKRYYNNKVGQNLLCAGEAEGEYFKKDPCPGDWGGPLICDGELTGLISLNMGCGQRKTPALYAEIYVNLYWIEEQLKATGSHSHVKFALMFLPLSLTLS